MAISRPTLIAIVGVAVLAAAGGGYLLTGGKSGSTRVAPGAPAAVAQASAPAGSQAMPWALAADDIVLGKADAPVTMFAYESFTCPHCADFHKTIWPVLKKDYVDSGKLKIVFRDFPLDQGALIAGVVARCGGPDRFYGLVEVIFATQDNWSRQKDVLGELRKIGRLGGIDDARLDACLQDQKLIDSIIARRMVGDKGFGIDSTPTFILSGRSKPEATEKLSGGQPVDNFRTAIERLAGKG